jgi:hypothetical protein
MNRPPLKNDGLESSLIELVAARVVVLYVSQELVSCPHKIVLVCRRMSKITACWNVPRRRPQIF